jgi:hypothetical protein
MIEFILAASIIIFYIWAVKILLEKWLNEFYRKEK